MTDEQTNGSGGPPNGPQPPKAEQVLEAWGRRAGRYLSTTAVRAREEAEDIWAEAQSLRRGERE